MTQIAVWIVTVLGAGVAGAWLGHGRAERRIRPEIQRLRVRLAAAEATASRLLDLDAQVSSLRHDVRGILSPAMLVADRLLGDADPGVRRAGEMVIRTVERTTARLAETRMDEAALDQAPPKTSAR